MIVIVRSYWEDFFYTSPKIKFMGGFFNFNIEMKWVVLVKSIDRCTQGRGFVPGSSIAGNWWRYNLCDIVTKASVAFVVSTDPDISADSKVQASIKHETKEKPIQACRIHSGALDERTSQRSTGKCSLLLFFKLGHIALMFLVVIWLVLIWLVLVQDSDVIKMVNENLWLFSSCSLPFICGRIYRRKLSERWLGLICDGHYLLL